MNTFPIYEDLVNNVKSGNYQQINIHNFCSIINNLNQEHIYIIALLIKHHSSIESKGISFQSAPYGAQSIPGGNGLLFKISDLPPFLYSIISVYLNRITE